MYLVQLLQNILYTHHWKFGTAFNIYIYPVITTYKLCPYTIDKYYVVSQYIKTTLQQEMYSYYPLP